MNDRRWTPVSERLPEDGATVLWAVEEYERRFVHKIGHSAGDKIFADDGISYWITARTHWMPLPKPPEGTP